MDVRDQVVVVTGGASGIGEAVSRYLASQGARVVIGDMDQEGIDRVVADIRSNGAEAVGRLVNVTRDEEVSSFMDFAVEQYDAINVVVPCAGIIRDGLFVSPDKETGKVNRFMSTDDFRLVLDVNLTGTFITLREAAIRMIDNGWSGVLFTISSIQKQGGVGQLNYSSTKAAVALWPKILVGEFAMRNITNIRVNSIAPGYVGTPMVRGMNQKALERIIASVHVQRLIEPVEIAKTIAMVIENDAIDAATIEVTGGVISGLIAK
jgi:3-oxoacyl-[acyl-carrier protein] reductase